MQVQVFRDRGVDDLQETQELLVAVPAVGLGDDRDDGHVVGGEQAGRDVTHVVVGHPRRGSRLYRQAGGGAVERLDLRLLVHGQDRACSGGLM